MHRTRHQDLPFAGSSHRFVGADHGDTNVSVFLFNGKPGAAQDHTATPTTRFSSSRAATACGW